MNIKKAGSHGFDGSCIPDDAERWKTFSVGIFEWVEKKGSHDVKKGKVKVRVKGDSNNPDAVFKKANEIAKELDDGKYSGPKVVTIKG